MAAVTGHGTGAAAGPRRVRPRAVSLSAVAAAVGVSRTTVSNAYNRPDQLSPALRARVLAAAHALGYPGPDPAARSLRTKQSDAVGLIFTERLDYAFRDAAAVRFLEGVAHGCETVGRSLLLIPAGTGVGHTATVARAVVDGFIIYSIPADDQHTAAALARPQPAVVVDSPIDVDGVDFVGIDDRAAFATLADHVLELGHRQIGAITVAGRTTPAPPVGPIAVAGSDVRGQRLTGLLDSMLGRGLDSRNLHLVDVAQHAREAGATAAAQLLEAGEVTAIMAMSDVLALGVLDELGRRGLKVPADVTVTGFDDIGLAAEVGLTTVRQPTYEKGQAAVEMLFRPPTSHAERRILPTELVVRTSSGPPRRQR